MTLADAVINNDIEMARRFLEDGADPKEPIDETNLQPIHFAAQNASVEMAKLLITAGADVNAKTEPDEETALDIAKLHGHKDFVDFILSQVSGGEQVH